MTNVTALFRSYSVSLQIQELRWVCWSFLIDEQKLVFIYSFSWKVQVSWRTDGGLRTHWRLTHYRWDIPGGRFLQVSQPFLSDYIPRLGPMLWFQRLSPRLFIPAANMITISPLYARHLPFPRCCHILCTPLIHPTSWEAGACLPVSQWEDSRAEGWSIQFSLSLPFFFSPSLPAPFLSSLPPSPVHTNIHGAPIGCRYCAWSSGYKYEKQPQ